MVWGFNGERPWFEVNNGWSISIIELYFYQHIKYIENDEQLFHSVNKHTILSII